LPRIIFDDPEEFIHWLNDIVRRKPENYVFFVTSRDEFIAMPVVSTRPHLCAYYKIPSIEEEGVKNRQRIMEAARSINLKIFFIERMDWDYEKMMKD